MLATLYEYTQFMIVYHKKLQYIIIIPERIVTSLSGELALGQWS